MDKEILNKLLQEPGFIEIQNGMKLIFEGLKKQFNLDIHDSNFIETPQRVAKAYFELFSGLKNTSGQLKKLFETSFPSCDYDEVILCKNMETYSMCPHHFLPVLYKINIAYMPKANQKVIGVSKLARLAELFSRQPILQETLTCKITNAINKYLQPQGSACIVEGRHLCIESRGIRKKSTVITSSLTGIFRENLQTRNELLALIKNY